jgi:hypothetical protein
MNRLLSITAFAIMAGILLLSSAVPVVASDGFTKQDRELLVTLKVKMEQIDKRFEQIDKRFGEIMTFMWMLVVIFSSITAATIGFAIWDRRTMIRPFEDRIKKIEEEKIDRTLSVLRFLAESDARIAEALKRYNLL